MTSLSGLKVRNFLLAKKIFSLVDLGCHIRTSSSIRVVQDHHLNTIKLSVFDKGGFLINRMCNRFTRLCALLIFLASAFGDVPRINEASLFVILS